MKTVIQDASQREIGCLVKGTSVKVEGSNRFSYKPIQDIEVGDKVLSAPENGIGEPVFKRVTKTFKFENKEIWYVGFIDITRPALTDVRDILVLRLITPLWSWVKDIILTEIVRSLDHQRI